MRKQRMVLGLLFMITLFWCIGGKADDGDRKSGLFSYHLKGNGTAAITGFDWSVNNTNDIYVPRYIDGYTVTEIGQYAFSSENEKSWIGQKVVVILPDTISVIGEKAFFRTEITAITIPQNCQYIGAGAFAGCRNIKNHSVAPENSTFATIDGVLYNKKTKELVSFPGGRSYSDFTMEFPIPEGIVSIGDYAFFGVCAYNNKSEESPSIIIPSTLKSIGEYAFAEADLRNVVFPNVETIHDHAFDKASLYKPVFSSIQSIGDYAFNSASYVLRYITSIDYTIVFPDTLESIGVGAFSSFEIYNSFTRVSQVTFDLSNTKVKSINKNAFNKMGATDIKSITVVLPSQLETIDECAFQDIGKVESYSTIKLSLTISIPSTVKNIESKAFQGTVLKITFEDNSEIKAIGNLSANSGRSVRPFRN